jgi:hypothetical protein
MASNRIVSSKILASIPRFVFPVLWLLSGAMGCGGNLNRQAPTAKVSTTVSISRADVAAAHKSPFRFFSPSSFWNTQPTSNAPLDPHSTEIIGAFNTLITADKLAGRSPTIDTSKWSIPIYTVPSNQPTVRVVQDKAETPPTLQSAWNAVPLPPDAQPAAGSDEHLAVWQPSTDRLWEFWRLVHGGEGWHARWGGAMENVSSNPGSYGPEAWPGATTHWGASASSLSIAGGIMTFEDFERGQINHALALAIPDVRGGVYSLPAHRTDGISANPLSLPEGAHLRLDPRLDLASLQLPKVTLMIAEAAQRYGIFVRSVGSVVALYGQDPISTGTNPYTGSHGFFEGQYPFQLLESFPWSHLQLLKMELRRNQ